MVSARIHRQMMICGALVLLTACALAAAPVPAENNTLANLQHTYVARQALQQDPLLASLQIGVRVEQRVAILWGPVPSAELARHAVAKLKELPELVGVRSELHVELPEDPASVTRRILRPELPVRPVETAEPRSEDSPMNILTAMTPLPRPATAGEDKKPVEKEPRSSFDERDGIVLPTIRVPMQGTVEAPPPPAPAAGGQAPHAPPVPLEPQVQRLQQGEPRYRRVVVGVDNGVVTLSGAVPRWDDMHALARAIARLPGVERVVLNSMRVDPALR
jgi:hypothetical protein